MRRKNYQTKAITGAQLHRLLKKQSYKCALSGIDLTPETASLDHRVPLSKGGQHAIENLWVVHCRVNSMKGTLMVDEFVDLCRKVVVQADCPPQSTSEHVGEPTQLNGDVLPGMSANQG